MENTIILGSGQKIEVLFQDEVSLDIDCALRYIESGQKEIAAYVQNTAKPQLDGVIAQAEADMAVQIAKGVADAASTASAAAAETINNSIDNANAQIEAYVAANITPDLDAALASAEEYASSAETTVNGFDEHAAALTQQVAASAASALASQTAASASAAAAEESADSALEAANKASFGNIGDIQYTCRTDVPNGGAWCDGAEYTQAAFPDIYQMLVDGKLQKTDYETFNSSVSTNGSCGMFALDTATTSFKVPLLKDIYIKAGQTPSTFGAESLPNITGGVGRTYEYADETQVSGAFYRTDSSIKNFGSGGGTELCEVYFDASRSSSTYQDGAKVNPDHVVYRAYVVLYASAAEASEAQAAEFMTALAGKANIGLDNVNPAQTFKDLSIGWGMPDYSAGVSITSYTSSSNQFVAPCDGVLIFTLDIPPSGVGIYIDDVLIALPSAASDARLGNTYSFAISKGQKFYVSPGSFYTAYGINAFLPFKGVN